MNNLKVMNKRGQFYLMAAIAVILIILGLAIVPNSLKKVGTDNSDIYELFVEINIDSQKLINYDTQEFNRYKKPEEEQDSAEQLDPILKQMMDTYPLIDKIYILIRKTGIQNPIRLYEYDGNLITKKTEQISSIITIDGIDYSFSSSGSFYYLIVQEKNRQQYAIKG